MVLFVLAVSQKCNIKYELVCTVELLIYSDNDHFLMQSLLKLKKSCFEVVFC